MPFMHSCSNHAWYAKRRREIRNAYIAKGWVGSERKLDEVVSRKLRGC